MNKLMLPCTLVWLVMMLLTVTTYAIGEAGMSGTTVVLIVLGIAVIKVQMVANYFMDLRHTRWLWRGIVLGWLLLVTGLIAIAYLTTIK